MQVHDDARSAPPRRSPSSGSSQIFEALFEAVPIVLAILPFGMVFGALAADAGLSLVEAMGLSGAIYAGASQLVILQLVALGTPLWSVLLAVVAVNFRHVLYSASIGRHLGRFGPGAKALAFYVLVDPLFAATEARAQERTITRSYYLTFGLLLYFSWLAATFAGVMAGRLIGDQRALGLDLLLPVYFLALTIQFRRREGFAPIFFASIAASILVYSTLGSPWHVTLGGLAGIATAAIRAPSSKTLVGKAAPDDRP